MLRHRLGMATAKPVLDVARAADLFKVLGHPHRLAIFLRLCDRCGTARDRDEDAYAACVGDLSAGLAIAPSTVSHHLKELRQAGIISVRRKGQQVECCANFEVVKQISAFIGKHCCCG